MHRPLPIPYVWCGGSGGRGERGGFDVYEGLTAVGVHCLRRARRNCSEIGYCASAQVLAFELVKSFLTAESKAFPLPEALVSLAAAWRCGRPGLHSPSPARVVFASRR